MATLPIRMRGHGRKLIVLFLVLIAACDTQEGESQESAPYTPWPALGHLQPESEAMYRGAGNLWYRGVIDKIGPIDGVGKGAYLIRDQHGTKRWYDRTHTSSLEREPFWSEFFLGDWEVSVPVAMTTMTDGRDLYRVVSGGMRLPPLRISADGSYSWRVLENGGERVITGQWRAREDAPGLILLQADQGADWMLYNATDLSTLSTFGRSQIYLTSDCCTSQTAMRIVPDPVGELRAGDRVLVQRQNGSWQFVKVADVAGDEVEVVDDYGIYKERVSRERLRSPEQ